MRQDLKAVLNRGMAVARMFSVYLVARKRNEVMWRCGDHFNSVDSKIQQVDVCWSTCGW